MGKIISSLVVIFLALGFIIPSIAAESYYVSGKEVLKKCTHVQKGGRGESYDNWNAAWCFGFIRGNLNAHLFYTMLLSMKEHDFDRNVPQHKLHKSISKYRIFCIPKHVNLGKIIDNVVDYLKDHPKTLNQDGSMVVFKALRKYYPCK